MAAVLHSFRYNLANLTRSGRDTRARFWPWAIFVFLAAFGAAFVVMGLAMFEAMTVSIRVHAGELPESAAVQATRELGWLWQPLAILATGAVLLLAASVARRLHDRGRSGAWGLLLLPFLALSIAGTPIGFRVASGQSEMSGLESMMFFSPPLFYLALAGLAFLLAETGDARANRFGAPPSEPP